MTIRNVMVFLAGLATMAGPLSAGAEEKPTRVVIGAEDSFVPWSLPDGTGAGNAIVREALRRQGVEVTLEVLPYARCRRAVETGDRVACLSVGATPDIRRDVLLPAMPLAQINARLMVRDGERPGLTHCDPQRWDKRPRIGIVNGYEYPAGWTRMVDSGRVEVVTVQSDLLGLRMLGAGRLDAMLLLFDQLRTPDGLMRRFGQVYPIRGLCSLGGIATYLGFSAARADALPLLRKFEEGYLEMDADGTLDAILLEWRDRQPDTAQLQ